MNDQTRGQAKFPSIATTAFIGIAIAAASLTIQAQDYPAKPIRLMVPYDAGGISDIVTRLVQPRMVAFLGQPLVIENRPGASGGIGTDLVARAPADGYTMISNFDSFATVPYLFAGIQHDPIKDFAPISLLIRNPQILAVDPKLGLTTIDQFLQHARRPGTEMTFSTAGAGSSSRLSMELFKSLAKFDSAFISYKGGAPAINAILGGHVTGMMVSLGVALNQVKAGKLTALGVSSAGRRSPLLPNVAPLSEAVPGFDAQAWLGFSVPAGTPRPIVSKLNAAVVQALQSSDVRDKLEAQGMEIVASSPEVYGEWIKTEVNKWRPIIERLKIRAD